MGVCARTHAYVSACVHARVRPRAFVCVGTRTRVRTSVYAYACVRVRQNMFTITSRHLSLVRAYTLAATFLAHALLTAVGTNRRAAALSALVEPRAARAVAVPLRRPYTPLLEPPILKHDFLC